MADLKLVVLERDKLIFKEEGEENVSLPLPLEKDKLPSSEGERFRWIILIHPVHLFIRWISLPHRPSGKEEEMVKFTVEESIPFSAEEIKVRFYRFRDEGKWKYLVYVIPPSLQKILELLREKYGEPEGIHLLPHYFYYSLPERRKIKPPFLILFLREGEILFLNHRNEVGAVSREKSIWELWWYSRSPGEERLYIAGDNGWGYLEEFFRNEGVAWNRLEWEENYSPIFSGIPDLRGREEIIPGKGILILFLIFILSLSAQILFKENKLQKELSSVQNEMRKVFQSVFPRTPLIDPLAQMRKKWEELGRTPSSPVIDILDDLNKKIRVRVVLDRLRLENSTLELEGEVSSYSQLDKLVKELGASSYFSRWEIVNAQSRKGGGVLFRLKGRRRNEK